MCDILMADHWSWLGNAVASYHIQDDLSYMFSTQSVAEHASLAIGLGMQAIPE